MLYSMFVPELYAEGSKSESCTDGHKCNKEQHVCEVFSCTYKDTCYYDDRCNIYECSGSEHMCIGNHGKIC